MRPGATVADVLGIGSRRRPGVPRPKLAPVTGTDWMNFPERARRTGDDDRLGTTY